MPSNWHLFGETSESPLFVLASASSWISMGKEGQKYRRASCVVHKTCLSALYALYLLRDSHEPATRTPGVLFWSRTGPAASPGQHGGRSNGSCLSSQGGKSRQRKAQQNCRSVAKTRGLGFLVAHHLVTLVGGERSREVEVGWLISISIPGRVEACKSSVDGWVTGLPGLLSGASAPLQPGGAGAPRFEARRSFGASSRLRRTDLSSLSDWVTG